jgi:oleate hydratase
VLLVPRWRRSGRSDHDPGTPGHGGGSLDGAGDAEAGYLTRGGRMFEPNFVCTLDLLSSIPAPDDPAISVRDDILAFNRMVPGRSECRLVRDGRKAEDRSSLGLGPRRSWRSTVCC